MKFMRTRQLAILVAASMALGFSPRAMGATYYWDIDGATPGSGGATPSQNWSASRWNTDSTGGGGGSFGTNPGPGDTVVFSAGTDATGSYTVTLVAPQSVNAVSIEEGGTVGSGGFTLAGSAITIGSGGLTASSLGNKAINSQIILGTSQTWSNSNTDNAIGPAGGISDGGNGYSLTKTGAGRINFGANINYTGGTLLSAGSIRLTATNTVTTANGSNNIITTNVNNAGTGSTQTGLIFGAAVAGTVTQYTISTLAGTGNIKLGDTIHNINAVALTLGATTSSNYADTTYSGVLSDGPVAGGSIIKNHVNTLTFTAANTYTGGTTLNGGKLLANNTTGSATGSGNVTVNSGATLGGSGTVGLISASSRVTVNALGLISPGNSPGILSIIGNQTTPIAGASTLSLTMRSGLFMELNGTTAGTPASQGSTQFDQIYVTGTVDLGADSLLGISLNYVPSLSQTFKIIDNNLSDAVLGRFYGLPTNGSLGYAYSSVDGNPYTFSINYAGGDGNDVVLTVAALNSAQGILLVIPEPSSLALLTFAALPMLRRRRQ